MAKNPTVAYDDEHVLILDYKPKQRGVALHGNRRTTPHDTACATVKTHFEKFTLAKVTTYAMPSNATAKDWLTFMANYLSSISERDHLTIYFGGQAVFSGNTHEEVYEDDDGDPYGIHKFSGLNYSLLMKTGIQGGKLVNFLKVFEVIEGSQARGKALERAEKKLNKSRKRTSDGLLKEEEATEEEVEEALLKSHYGILVDVGCDITIILDAKFPNKIINDFRRETGTTTVICQPPIHEGVNGKPMGLEGDWTEDVFLYMIKLLGNADTKYRKWKETTKSIADIIALVGKNQADTTGHYFSDKPRSSRGGVMLEGPLKLITRPVLDIAALRKYGKFQFVAEVVQGEAPTCKTPTRMALQHEPTVSLREIAKAAGVDLDQDEDQAEESDEEQLFVAQGPANSSHLKHTPTHTVDDEGYDSN